MPSHKSKPPSAPKLSSTTSLAVAATTSKSNSSSILRSSFSPSRLQLSLFASVIQGLDGHHLRIHDTTTNRLRCEYTAQPRVQITALDWGYYGDAYRIPDEEAPKKKRRKAGGEDAGQRDVVVAVATSAGTVQFFSPSQGKVLGTLKSGHGGKSISDFRFKNFGLEGEAWSAGQDGKLLQWSLRSGEITTQYQLPGTPSLSALLPLCHSLLVAAESAWLVRNEETPQKLGSGEKQVHHLLANVTPEQKEPPSLYLAAVEDRYLNVYDVASTSIVGSLIAEGDVSSMATYQSDSETAIVAALTANAEIEIFSDPFSFQTAASAKTGDLKSKRKQMTRKAAANIKIRRPSPDATKVTLAAVSFQENDLVIAYVEGGVHLAFEHVPWRDEQHNGLKLKGALTITKANTVIGIANRDANSVKDLSKSQINEARAVVSKGTAYDQDDMVLDVQEVIDISSAEEEEEEEEDDDSDSDGSALDAPEATKALTNGAHADTEMADVSEDGDGDGDGGSNAEDAEPQSAMEPSFGELIRSNATGVIDVAASLPQEKRMVSSAKGTVKLPSGLSLATVLSQSLRTNDVSMLESCFHEQDLHVVRATIERLDSSLATTLLKKLAERLHSRPGRAGSLMVWIQWTLVAHGGFLASQPTVVKQLSSLHSVVRERASSLQPLLSLKGKLDMLEAQMNMRKSMQSKFGRATGTSEDVDENVIYVEGQEDEEDEEGSESEADATGPDLDSDSDEMSEEEDDGDDLPAGMEVDGDDDSEMGSGDGLIDDEASVTSDEDSEEDGLGAEVDHDDVDSGDEESEDEAPVAKGKGKKLTNGVVPKKRR